ncbi:hypothetical protein VOLCADRAFT_105406 [Volvox carteri f. nagariensis]|uniref:UspA domain-containing protein n=1 Tax=Volvox carteri f. nagariensis TaxID=3068 RepID=D8U0M2_VOLCA|nr:uncharacterized protein VOLCADRAFT_105406 [Volvox carteri f. nagariensis]EFJ46744.1 hypothetical protein VOLCADRAFT_105406 [Volvox carteri f. nagariensis]|eukprot:XP_002952273.1 hypothetical protein VOLCADRAFT_105406 [Volvox carteri f. nagariensis]
MRETRSDDTDDSQKSWDWIINNFYRDGDEVHLLNVISRLTFAATLGVPAVDFTPQINREAYEKAVQKAEAFIVKRFLARLPESIQTTPIVHIIKSEVDTNSVGHVICMKADELKATCILMGSHNKGPVAEFFMGSVSQEVCCKRKLPACWGSELRAGIVVSQVNYIPGHRRSSTRGTIPFTIGKGFDPNGYPGISRGQWSRVTSSAKP